MNIMSEIQTSHQEPYRVLARKYRPQSFSELIGQDALVRTLTNAIENGRIAHAFMLTGVRGVGKTTTARIIAKALNYKGPDGTGGATVGPTDDCPLCQAIAEDRHPDVIEMDAASRTGVEDIREILDGVRYAPTEARYKVYIIDEVHMLSRQAFNALLKTLEEPPEHVKFIFATTEIRKVPVTVLSRCQRFDLRRVDSATLSAHYKSICEQENTKIDDEALALISRAADGSVRDGLSILDQAMALSGDEITAQQVKDMLGLADRSRALDILDKALSGDMPEALEILDDMYAAGADPVALMQDLLELTHLLTRMRAVGGDDSAARGLSQDIVDRLKTLSGQLSMPTLGKSWQILLKGLGEVQSAPMPQAAAEMIIIRLAYAADLPDPGDLIKRLKDEPAPTNAPSAATTNVVPASSSPAPVSASGNAGGPGPAQAVAAQPAPSANTERALSTLEDIHAALEETHNLVLAGQVYMYVHPIKISENRIEMRLSVDAPPGLSQNLGKALGDITGTRWMVSVSDVPGAPTMAEAAQAEKDQERAKVLQFPVIQEILSVFPDAELDEIQTYDDVKKDKQI